MTNRREFIKRGSAALMLALPAMSFIRSQKAVIPAPGVQLFTFFNTMDADVEGTLQKAASAGIKNIESAFSRKGDFYGLKAQEFSKLLTNLGMEWRAHHVFGAPVPNAPFKNLKENLTEIIDNAGAGGIKYLVAGHLPIATEDEVKISLDILNASAGPCRKAGIQLVYHNEPADFQKVGAQTPYEVFLTKTDSDALKFELDIAWAIKGGQDPDELFTKYPGRFPLWHLKDLSKDHQTVLPLGEGVLDYRKYFGAAGKSGLKYYFIEHENPADPIASIKKSIATVQSIIK
jgi:sugar phosphate isomerase/epimerase